MIKKIILVIHIITLIQLMALAQSSTYSPYSRYGLGDLSVYNGKIQSMGGTAIGIRSNSQLNFLNPAAISIQDTLTFTWEFGLNGSYTKFSTEDDSMDKLNGNINSMAIGFPINGWWYTAVGLLPYSSVGYNITQESSSLSPWGVLQDYQSFYEGSGGISQVVFANAFKIKKNFSVGLNVKYLFGTIDHTRILNYVDEEGSTNPEFLSAIVRDQVIVSDFVLDFGIQYAYDFNNDNKLTIGLVAGNESSVKAYNTSQISVGNSFGVIDTVYNVEGEDGEIIMPIFVGAGFSYQYKNVTFAADYLQQNWSNSTFLGKKDSLSDLSRLSFGLEYVPNKRSIKYLSRVNYRAGLHSSNTYLNLQGEQLKDFGISLGLGLPVQRGRSMINFAFEYGQRGTIQNNLIKENYGLISLNLSLHDIWFVKRRFD